MSNLVIAPIQFQGLPHNSINSFERNGHTEHIYSLQYMFYCARRMFYCVLLSKVDIPLIIKDRLNECDTYFSLHPRRFQLVINLCEYDFSLIRPQDNIGL